MDDDVEIVGLSYYVSYFNDEHDEYATYHSFEFRTKDLALFFYEYYL